MSALSDTVYALVAQQAVQQPDAVYAIDPETGQELTYLALLQSCRRVTALLRSHGLKPGDTVSLVMPNSLATLQLLLGAIWGGFCVNPVNLLSLPDQMQYVLEHSDCRLGLVSPEWELKVRALLRHTDREIVLQVVTPDAEIWTQTFASAPESQPTGQAPALLMYTSGTTGRPKGVLQSQASLLTNAWSISLEHGLGPADRVLAVLPLYHINAFVVTMLAPLAHGGSLVLPARFSGTQFWQLVRDHQCSWINLVPTMISYLLEGSDPADGQMQGIRFCRSASAALPVSHLRAFEERFGIGVIETMGLTETAAPSFSNPLEPSRRKPGSVGRASGCQARIVDVRLAPLPDGAIGEITICGPHLMSGYYKDPTATQVAFTPDGWLRTGDLGYRDSDGFFFVTGRIKELIIKGGENIAPREIDEALLRHPAVLDAAAVGMPDPHYGQDILACVVLRHGHSLDEATLRKFCINQLGRFKTPRVFQFVSSLPRGPTGKVQRLKLLGELVSASVS